MFRDRQCLILIISMALQVPPPGGGGVEFCQKCEYTLGSNRGCAGHGWLKSACMYNTHGEVSGHVKIGNGQLS